MFVLVLNPMRGRREERRKVARAETREELVAFLREERLPEPTADVEPEGYLSGWTWTRYFRPGPLHWFNDCRPGGEPDPFGIGIHELRSREEVAAVDVASFDRLLAGIPTLAALRAAGIVHE